MTSNYFFSDENHFGHDEVSPFKRNTMIWYTKRQRWKLGPELPIEFSRLCSTALNSTSALMAFINTKNGNDKVEKMSVYDFYARQWVEIPNIIIQSYLMSCAMTTWFDKRARQMAMVLVEGQ